MLSVRPAGGSLARGGTGSRGRERVHLARWWSRSTRRSSLTGSLRALAHTRVGARAVGSLHGVVTNEPVFALTFDDGPDPNITPGILELLAARGELATFFMRADRAVEYPDLARRVAAEGHEVGVHGFRHDRLTELGPSGVWRETVLARRELRRIVGVKPHWFRPPHGAQNLRTFLATRMQGMDVAVWAVSVRDAFSTQGVEIEAGPGRGLNFRVDGVDLPFAVGNILLLHRRAGTRRSGRREREQDRARRTHPRRGAGSGRTRRDSHPVAAVRARRPSLLALNRLLAGPEMFHDDVGPEHATRRPDPIRDSLRLRRHVFMPPNARPRPHRQRYSTAAPRRRRRASNTYRACSVTSA